MAREDDGMVRIGVSLREVRLTGEAVPISQGRDVKRIGTATAVLVIALQRARMGHLA